MGRLKNVTAKESDYNTMALIAKKNGLIYPEGHAKVGKMIPSLVIEFLIKNFREPIA